MTNNPQKPGYELAPTGTRVAVGGKEELRQFLDSVLAPLGFQRDPKDLQSTARYCGTFSGRDLGIRFSVRKRTRNIGTPGGGIIDYRTFEGLSMEVEVPTTIPTRLTVAQAVNSGFIQSLTGLFAGRRAMTRITDPRPLFSEHEIWAADETWAQAFLGRSEVTTGLEDLTDATERLRSWSLVFIPQKMTVSRRLTSMANFTTDEVHSLLAHIIQLANIGEQTPTSRTVELGRVEKWMRDNPKAVIGVGCVLLLGLMTLPALLLVTLAILLGS